MEKVKTTNINLFHFWCLTSNIRGQEQVWCYQNNSFKCAWHCKKHEVFHIEDISSKCDQIRKKVLWHFQIRTVSGFKNGRTYTNIMLFFANERHQIHIIFNSHKSLHKTWSFPLRISSVNVTKSGGNCGFGHIY